MRSAVTDARIDLKDGALPCFFANHRPQILWRNEDAFSVKPVSLPNPATAVIEKNPGKKASACLVIILLALRKKQLIQGIDLHPEANLPALRPWTKRFGGPAPAAHATPALRGRMRGMPREIHCSPPTTPTPASSCFPKFSFDHPPESTRSRFIAVLMLCAWRCWLRGPARPRAKQVRQRQQATPPGHRLRQTAPPTTKRESTLLALQPPLEKRLGFGGGVYSWGAGL